MRKPFSVTAFMSCRCVYVIKHGYLTPPERLDMPVVQYDFSRLQAQSNRLFSEADLNRELKKQQRITPHIINDYGLLQRAKG